MSWLRDGSTRQELYRDCLHATVSAGRCEVCRARQVGEYVSHSKSLGGTPLTSAYVVAPKLSGWSNMKSPGGVSKEEWNHSPRKAA